MLGIFFLTLVNCIEMNYIDGLLQDHDSVFSSEIFSRRIWWNDLMQLCRAISDCNLEFFWQITLGKLRFSLEFISIPHAVYAQSRYSII